MRHIGIYRLITFHTSFLLRDANESRELQPCRVQPRGGLNGVVIN